MDRMIRIILLLSILYFCIFIGHVTPSNIEKLQTALKSSIYKKDVLFQEKAVFCVPCEISIVHDKNSHTSNILRHFTSNAHKLKAQWIIQEEFSFDGNISTFNIKNFKQKTTLLTYFGRPKKTEKQVDSEVVGNIPIYTPSRVEMDAKSLLSEIKLKEKLGEDMEQQISKTKKVKANELVSNIQQQYKELVKDEGNDNHHLELYIHNMATNIAQHFSWKCETMVNEIQAKEAILTNTHLTNKQNILEKVTQIENLDITEFMNSQFMQQIVSEKLNNLLEILNRQHELERTYTTAQICQSIEKTVTEKDSVDKDLFIKLSLLLQKDDSFSKFLCDILKNMDKSRPTWSESTANLFSLLLNYGGPKAVELMKQNFGGPSLSRVYFQARQNVHISTELNKKCFQKAFEFYSKLYKNFELKSIMFTIAVDATPVLPLIRVKGNEILGFATNERIIVNSADDIISLFKDGSRHVRAQQTYVFVLVPLRSDVPYFILAAPPVVKGESQNTALMWLQNSKTWAREYNLNIFGLGADGDSKIRSFYTNRYLKETHHLNGYDGGITIERDDFAFILPPNNDQCIDSPFPDPRHLLKKWRNQVLNIRRLLIMGDKLVQLEHLMELADHDEFKHSLGLWKTDIRVNDKQNVNAAVRLFNENVQDHLKLLDESRFKGTIAYLKIGHVMHELYFNKELSLRTRIRYAWTMVQFCRLWRSWILLSKYNTDRNSISDQTYSDILIAGHSFILMAKVHMLHYADQPFEPWTWGSNACEDVFSKSRCFVRTKNNFCYAEFIDICRRIQKVTETECEMKRNKKCISSQDIGVSSENIDTAIFEELQLADKVAVNLIRDVNIISDLSIKGIVDTNGNLNLKTWNIEKHIFFSKNDDEMDILSADEIESLDDHDILCTVIANDDELLHSSDLIDIACDNDQHNQYTSDFNVQNTKQLGQKEINSESHELHHLHVSKRAKTDSISIGSLQEAEPERGSQDSSEILNEQNRKNTHIMYKGHWYHISRFVAWEQGKFYMPKQCRLTRFYASYAIFDKFLPEVNKDETLRIDHSIAMWDQGKYLFGIVKRIILPSSKGKCAHPHFFWKKPIEDKSICISEFAIQLLDALGQKDAVPFKLKTSKKFQWISSRQFVLRITFKEENGCFILDPEIRQQLIDAIPHLKKNDLLEEKKRQEDKKRKLEEKKAGPPEKMTVEILKSILRDHSIRYTSKDKKADLVKLVKEKVAHARDSGADHQRKVQKFKKRGKKIRTIIVKHKRTIYHSYYGIAFDTSKHYLYTIYLYLMHILWDIFGLIMCLQLTITYMFLNVLWTFILQKHLTCVAVNNTVCITDHCTQDFIQPHM